MKAMKARVSQLCKTEAEWLKWYNWTPTAGEIIVYKPDETYNYARIKIGDGNTILGKLDFCVSSSLESILNDWHYESLIDGGNILSYIKEYLD
jgi:hypothetical protein